MTDSANAPQSPNAFFTLLRGIDRRWWIAVAAAGLVMSACLLACLGVVLVSISRPPAPISVTLIVSGTGYRVQTSSRTVGDLLREYGLTLSTGDRVLPETEAPLTSDVVVRIERARPVLLTIDGQPQTLYTTFNNPLDILESAGISLGSKDGVRVDGTETDALNMLTWPVPANAISIQRALTVTIEDGTQTITLETTAPTVGEALFEASVPLYLADEVIPDVTTPLAAGLTVTIRRSQPISIIADGVTLETRTQGATVADALGGAGVMLMGLDYAIPDETAPLQPGMSIRVIRVTEQVEVEQAVLPFETVYQADAEMELDQRRVLQEGQNGIQQTNIRIRYENGIEVSRASESSGVARDPVNRVVVYGTRVVVRTVDTPDGPREYWRVLRMYATSYHPAALGGDNRTALGRLLTKGVVAIDPKIIPYDTQLYVPDYGVGVAADTGGPRRFKLWIDLGYDDENWVSWSRYVDVYLLTPVPATIDYLLGG
jgi:uncharacterized protein YabE (DUF348 family)